jgi:hypothetical protein
MSSLVIDAAYPPPAVPAGVSGVMGYIGGAALRVWTPAEWAPFHAVRQFPIWVANTGSNATAQALAAVKAVVALGWDAHLPQSENRVIVCDLEVSSNAAWYAVWSGTVTGSGFTSVAYGSLSTVLGNDAAHVLAADWDGIKSIPAGQTIHGVQYQANVKVGATEVDYDLFDSWLMARGGVGPRHA